MTVEECMNMAPCSGCGVCKCRCRCVRVVVGYGADCPGENRRYWLADGLADAKAIVSTWPEYKQRAAGEDRVLGLRLPVDPDDDNPCIVRGED